MQKSVSHCMKKDDGLIVRNSRIGIAPNQLLTIPQKRKCDIRMKPELCQSQNASECPAKQRKLKFNSLQTFWRGGLEKESKHTNSQKISDGTQAWKQTLSETNPVIGDEDKVKGGCPADVDLEEGGGNQSELSFCSCCQRGKSKPPFWEAYVSVKYFLPDSI
jgi:hypothetical protein